MYQIPKVCFRNLSRFNPAAFRHGVRKCDVFHKAAQKRVEPTLHFGGKFWCSDHKNLPEPVHITIVAH